MIGFGPELVGRTEKTLGALLRQTLSETVLDERQYVTLKVASSLVPSDNLTDEVRRRAHFADSAQLVEALTEAGLLAEGRLSAAGTAVLQQILDASARRTDAIWTEIAAADIAATERVLNTVLARAEAALAG